MFTSKIDYRYTRYLSIYLYIYIYIYIYIYKVCISWMTQAEGDAKAPVPIATMPKCCRGRYFSPGLVHLFLIRSF